MPVVAVVATLEQQVRGAVEETPQSVPLGIVVVVVLLVLAEELATAAGAEGVRDRAAMALPPAPIMAVIVRL
jgi:hypothetical protein